MSYVQPVEATEAKSGGTCCQGCAKTYLYAVNALVLVSGIILFGVSIFVAVVQADIVEALGEAGIVGPIVAGVFLMLTAMLGCAGVCCKNKFVMLVYLLLTTTLAAAFLGVGALFTFSVKNLDNVDGLDSATVTDRVESRLNDFLIAVFNECCVNTLNLDENFRLLGCSDDDAIPEACFTFEETYEAALDRVKNSQLCLFLENFEIDGVPVTGADSEECADGDGVAFKAILTATVEELLIPIGSAFLSLGSILLLTMISTCVVLCARKNEVFEVEENKAGAMAFGSPAQEPPPLFPPPPAATFDTNPKFNGSF